MNEWVFKKLFSTSVNNVNKNQNRLPPLSTSPSRIFIDQFKFGVVQINKKSLLEITWWF